MIDRFPPSVHVPNDMPMGYELIFKKEGYGIIGRQQLYLGRSHQELGREINFLMDHVNQDTVFKVVLENHSGRELLEKTIKPFGRLNGQDLAFREGEYRIEARLHRISG